MTADTTAPFGAYRLKPWRAGLLSFAQAMPVNWSGRRGALYARKLALLKGPAVVDAEVDGLNLRLYMNDNVSERKFLFMPQFFDPFERALLKKELKNGGVFVDVGANAGVYSLTAAALVGEQGKVVSIEPNPAVLERLVFNARLNGFEKRVVTVQVAVSDNEGIFTLTLDDTNLGGSSLVSERSAHVLSVPCQKLLAVVEQQGLSKIDAIKADIEGAEDMALVPFFKDAPPALHPRLLIVENSVSGWKQDLPAALKAAGYTLLKQTRMNLVYTKAGA